MSTSSPLVFLLFFGGCGVNDDLDGEDDAGVIERQVCSLDDERPLDDELILLDAAENSPSMLKVPSMNII